MKSFFPKSGFRKMEKEIAFKAQRNALINVSIWSFYESWKAYTQHRSLNSIFSLLLVTTSVILILSQFVLQKRVVKDDDMTILLGVIVTAIIISINVLIVFYGI